MKPILAFAKIVPSLLPMPITLTEPKPDGDMCLSAFVLTNGVRA